MEMISCIATVSLAGAHHSRIVLERITPGSPNSTDIRNSWSYL